MAASDETARGGDRRLLWASAAAAALGVVARLHNIGAFPPLRDYDASGHAQNVLELFDGRLPDPRSWSGSHPPLYHGLGAVLWKLFPDGIPVHTTLRFVSVAAFVLAVAIVWRTLVRLVGEVDAAIVSALLLGIPGILIGTGMMTNDPLCALFVTATLARLVSAPGDAAPDWRHAAITGVLAGLATMTKASGFAAVGVAGLWYLWRSRRDARTALLHATVLGVVAALVAAPHYLRLLLTLSGSPFEILIGYAGSEERRAISEFLSLPPEAFRAQVPLLMHAAVWGDPFGVLVPVEGITQLFAFAGLLVIGLGVAGAVHVAKQRELREETGAALLYAALLAFSFLRMVWVYPHPMLLKPGYVLSGVLPGALLLGYGLAVVRAGILPIVRGGLLAIAFAGGAVTWYGWWSPVAPEAPAGEIHAEIGSAEEVAERYFRLLADDPIRLQTLLEPEVHLARGIRLSWFFDESFVPRAELSEEERRSLELSRARVAELELYNLAHWYQTTAAGLRVSLVEAREDGDDATVTVRVQPSESARPPEVPGLPEAWPFPAFEQRFTLRRDERWRIAAIEQDGVTDENAAAAFVAHPTLLGLESVSERSSWPEWKPSAEPPSPPQA